MDRYINGTWEPSPKNTIGAAFAAKKVLVSFMRWYSMSSVVPCVQHVPLAPSLLSSYNRKPKYLRSPGNRYLWFTMDILDTMFVIINSSKTSTNNSAVTIIIIIIIALFRWVDRCSVY
jgi:hypothetical protein